MNFEDFGCKREDIERVSEKYMQEILVALYCEDKFEIYNMIDFYYRKTNTNAILMFILILIIYPLLFMYISEIADKYMATGMADLS